MKHFAAILAAAAASVFVGAAGVDAAGENHIALCRSNTGKVSEDHFKVSGVTFTPDQPDGGKPLSVVVEFTPDVQIQGPLSAIVDAKIEGVHLFGVVVEDLCASLEKTKEVRCPMEKGQPQKLTLSLNVPELLPKNVEMSFKVKFFSRTTDLSCVDVSFTTAPTVLRGNVLKEARWMDEPSLRFVFTKWLEQFHHIASDVSMWYKKEDEPSKKKFEERFGVFARNFFDVVSHNRQYRKGKVSYEKKLNQFGHLTPHEFKSMYLTGYNRRTSPIAPKPSDEENTLSSFLSNIGSMALHLIPNSPAEDIAGAPVARDDLPNELDWVEKGAVTPVKNQGSCGSCWAFSAIAALEGAYFLKYGELKEFSEQELVSCEEDCYGCQGGLMDEAFAWIGAHGGVCSEESYPYVSGSSGRNEICKVGASPKCTPEPKTKITSFVNVDHTEEAVKAAVAERPISIAIEADQYAFQFYSGGVITGECGDRDDHGVTLVGYGNLDGTDYWKVKNSWGTSWGMEGYVLLQRGKVVPSGSGQCGLLVDPVYPVL